MSRIGANEDAIRASHGARESRLATCVALRSITTSVGPTGRMFDGAAMVRRRTIAALAKGCSCRHGVRSLAVSHIGSGEAASNRRLPPLGPSNGPFMARTPARPVGANFGSRLRAASIVSGVANELDVAAARRRRALVEPAEPEALVEGQRRRVARARADAHAAPAGPRQRVRDERRAHAAPEAGGATKSRAMTISPSPCSRPTTPTTASPSSHSHSSSSVAWSAASVSCSGGRSG